MRSSSVMRILRVGAVGAAGLAAATVLTATLEAVAGIADASPVYLLAVVAMAVLFGTWPAVATSMAAVVIYDFLFTAPRFTFLVADPTEWLSLLLFLVVSVVVGRLTALQTERAALERRRAREAVTLFGLARSLATAGSARAAAGELAARLREAGGFERVWIALGRDPAVERPIADTAPDLEVPETRVHLVLQRRPGDEPARWVRIHAPGPPQPPPGEARTNEVLQVAIEAEGRRGGSVWATLPAGSAPPDPSATRLLSLAADQLALAMRREALAEEATSAEVARRSDALKSALVDSVSHDLRTPLTHIRTLAGSLTDEAVQVDTATVRRTAAEIDARAAHMGAIVQNLLDLSRLEAGAIRPNLEVHDVDEIVEVALRHISAGGGVGPTIGVEMDPRLPPILVDAIFMDEALSNVLENAVRHARTAPIRVRAEVGDGGRFVDLVVEDGGPGVAPEDLPHLFEKFYRRRPAGSAVEPRSGGMGIGLSVARGLAEAMGAVVTAEPSSLGGLAIRFHLPAAPSVP